MLVSHSKRFIFLKTVKTAGTSVEIYFEKFCRNDDEAENHATPQRISEAGIVGARGKDIPPGTTYWNHMPAADIRTGIGDEKWNSYNKFTVVRNPFDKIVSAFWFFHRQMNMDVDLGTILVHFKKYVLEGDLPLDKKIYTIDGVPCDAFYMRYENLHAEMERFCGIIGVPFEPARLGHYKGEHRPKIIDWRRYFDDETADRVRDVFADEFRWFGYPVEI